MHKQVQNMERSQKGVYSFDWSAAMLEWCLWDASICQMVESSSGCSLRHTYFRSWRFNDGHPPTLNLLKESLIGSKQYLISVSVEVQLIYNHEFSCKTRATSLRTQTYFRLRSQAERYRLARKKKKKTFITIDFHWNCNLDLWFNLFRCSFDDWGWGKNSIPPSLSPWYILHRFISLHLCS